MAVIIVALFLFFPEVKSSLTCMTHAGSFDYQNGICKGISEDFCSTQLKGEFLGCEVECKDEYSIRTCEEGCFGSCKTETYDQRFE